MPTLTSVQARIARAPTYITSHTPPCMNGAGTSIITGYDVLVQGPPIYIVCIIHILVSPLFSCTKGMCVDASYLRILRMHDVPDITHASMHIRNALLLIRFMLEPILWVPTPAIYRLS